MSNPVSIIEAIETPELFGAAMGDLESWRVWIAVLKAAFALPLSNDERAIFAEVSGGREPPAQRVKELWAIAGRRGGKSRMAGLIASYLAAFSSHKLAVGETGSVVALAVNKSQASAVFNYSLGFLQSSPVLSQSLVGDPTTEEIRLEGNVVIGVHPANFRSIRSRTLLGAVFDELSFWRDGDTSSNPDSEIYSAALPALATTGGLLVGISSPYRRTGLLFRKYEAAFGKNDENVLVVKAPSMRLNPTINADVVDRASDMDPEAARSEWEAEFRNDLSDFFTRVAVEASIENGVHERPHDPRNAYVAFCDPSGGTTDSMCLGIAHREGVTTYLDAVREIKAPCVPEAVVSEFASLCRSYRLSSMTGDRYAAEWVSSQFRNAGIFYEKSKLSKSEIYLESLPQVNSHSFKLLDNDRLKGQLLCLERRTSRSGRDTVDHPSVGGAKDDLANAALGALVLAAKGNASAYVRRTRREIEDDYFIENGRHLDWSGSDPLHGF